MTSKGHYLLSYLRFLGPFEIKGRLPIMNYTHQKGKTRKRFSIRLKLLLIFGFLIIVSVFSLGFLATTLAKKATREKVENHLVDKASDIAEIISGRVTSFFQFLEGIARMPILQDEDVSEKAKMLALKKEAAFNPEIIELNLTTLEGKRHTSG